MRASGDEALYEDALLMFESEGGVDKVELLQNHEREEVYKKALSLIHKHFNADDDDDDAHKASNGAPPIANQENVAPSSVQHFDFQ